MIRIKDQMGEIVQGAFRTDAGAISIYDPEAHGKYMKELDRVREVHSLNKKVDSLEKLVQQLITKLEEK
jgi:hypothetical protein